jgi:hypothetical protein
VSLPEKKVAVLAQQINRRILMRRLALVTSVIFLIVVMAAATIRPGISDATATLLFGVQY